jgi:hypothetical protein
MAITGRTSPRRDSRRIHSKEIPMTDNLRKHHTADAKRVNVHEKWEVAYWTKKFGVSEAKLKEAASAAGPMVANIEKYLQQH